MTRPTLHLVPEAAWLARDPSAAYLPAAYPADGFVHCTDGDAEMVATANRFYRPDPQPFLLLTLDLERTGSPWRFDDPGQRYPHVYGPIDPASVIEVRRFVRDADGTFTGIRPILDTSPTGALAAFSWGAGRVDLFERTAGATLRHRAWVDGVVAADEDLGGTLASAPTVVAWAVDQAEVFAVFPDGALWNRYWDGSAWHSWESLGGELDPAATPACASWGPDRLDVFARGLDGASWHRWWDGSRWVPWERLPG